MRFGAKPLRRPISGSGKPAGVLPIILPTQPTQKYKLLRQIALHNSGGDIFRRAGIAGAMVGAVKVVIDGFRNADNVAVPTRTVQILADFIAGIHTVVAAVIEEIADIVFFENF